MAGSYLVGAEKYTQPMVTRKTRGMELVDRANSMVDLFDVLEEFFGVFHPREGKSYKGFCPFGFEHPDGGMDKGWRTYPATNSSHCFVMHGLLNPVRLMQIKHDEKPVKAAVRLLEHYKLIQPKHWRERYQDLLIEREQRQRSAGNPQHAVEALNLALTGIQGYDSRQFDADVMRAMEIVLDKLDDAVSSDDPEQAIRKWYKAAKKGMARVIQTNRETDNG